MNEALTNLSLCSKQGGLLIKIPSRFEAIGKLLGNTNQRKFLFILGDVLGFMDSEIQFHSCKKIQSSIEKEIDLGSGVMVDIVDVPKCQLKVEDSRKSWILTAQTKEEMMDWKFKILETSKQFSKSPIKKFHDSVFERYVSKLRGKASCKPYFCVILEKELFLYTSKLSYKPLTFGIDLNSCFVEIVDKGFFGIDYLIKLTTKRNNSLLSKSIFLSFTSESERTEMLIALRNQGAKPRGLKQLAAELKISSDINAFNCSWTVQDLVSYLRENNATCQDEIVNTESSDNLLFKGSLSFTRDKEQNLSTRLAFLVSNSIILTKPLGKGLKAKEVIAFSNDTILHVNITRSCFGKTKSSRLFLEKFEHSTCFALQFSDDMYYFSAKNIILKQHWTSAMASALLSHRVMNDDIIEEYGWQYRIIQGTLHSFAYNGLIEPILELLMRKETDYVDLQDDFNEATPLHLAVYKGFQKIVECLLGVGANPCILDSEQHQPIHLAIQNFNSTMIELLLKAITRSNNVPTEIHNCRGDFLWLWSILEQQQTSNATETQALECFNILWSYFKEKSEDKIHASVDSLTGYSLLHLSAQKNLALFIRKLVLSGCDVDLKTFELMTPLHVAAENGSSEAIRALLELGALPNANDGRKNTPLQFVMSNGNISAAQIMIEHGARLSEIRADKSIISKVSIFQKEFAGLNNLKIHDMAEISLTRMNDRSSEYCNACESVFGFMGKKRTCKICELLVCKLCSSKQIIVGGSKFRICDGCFNHARYKIQGIEIDMDADREKALSNKRVGITGKAIEESSGE